MKTAAKLAWTWTTRSPTKTPLAQELQFREEEDQDEENDEHMGLNIMSIVLCNLVVYGSILEGFYGNLYLIRIVTILSWCFI